MNKALPLLLLALLWGSAAMAQSRDTQFFRELDSNGDGEIDREEYRMNKGAVLYALDANRSLSLESGETKMPPGRFQQYAGPDKKIGSLEFFEMPETQFQAFDQNHDNKITQSEFRQHLAEMRDLPLPQAAEGR